MLKFLLIVIVCVLQYFKLSPPISWESVPNYFKNNINLLHLTKKTFAEIYQSFLGSHEFCRSIQQPALQQEGQNECLPPEGCYNCINRILVTRIWSYGVYSLSKYVIKRAYFFWTREFLISKHASASFLPWTVIRTKSAPLSAILITYISEVLPDNQHFLKKNCVKDEISKHH